VNFGVAPSHPAKHSNVRRHFVIVSNRRRHCCSFGYSIRSSKMDVIKKIINKPRLNESKLCKACDSFIAKEQSDGDGSQSCNALVTFLLQRGNDCDYKQGIHKILICLKILLRGTKNRQLFLSPRCRSAIDIISSLIKNPMGSRAIAQEVSNVVLNLCHEDGAVEILTAAGVTSNLAALIVRVNSDDFDVLAAAFGAMMSICHEREGRIVAMADSKISAVFERTKVVLEFDEGLPFDDKENINPLSSTSLSALSKCQNRALGLLHNLSSDAATIARIRKGGLIPAIARFLRNCKPSLVASAASTLQNLSGEAGSRQILKECNAVELFLDLVGGTDTKVQISSCGALMNLVGENANADGGGETRIVLRKTLSDLVFLGAMADVFS